MVDSDRNLPVAWRRPVRRGLLIGPVLGLALLLSAAGCGGGDEPTPTAGAPAAPTVVETGPDPVEEVTTPPPTQRDVAPCELVTKAEAERLAGTPLNDGRAVRQTCTYTGPVTGPTAQVEVFVGDGAAKFLDIERQLGHELRPLVGIGDEAYAGDGEVFLNKAGLWVAIRLVRLRDPAENVKPLEELARTVAGRL